MSRPVEAAPRETPNGRLTPRQLEVLCLLCEGMPNKLISRSLNIATATVKIHVAAVFRELGVSNRLQAVVAAQRLGLGREWLADAAPGCIASPGMRRPQ